MNGQAAFVLMVGTPELCATAGRVLREHVPLPEDLILARHTPQEALDLLSARPETGAVLLLCEEPDAALPELMASLGVAGGRAPRPVLLRCRTPLPAAQRDELWRLGAADRQFGQAIDSPGLADAVAAVMRSRERIAAIGDASEAAAALEQAGTLWELGEAVLGVARRHGMGERGGLFCLLGGFEQPRLMAVAGTGRYASVGCRALDDIRDTAAIAAVRDAMAARSSRFSTTAAVLYVPTSEGDVACIYLALERALTPWQQYQAGLLSNAFAIAIGKNQAGTRLLRTQHATISTMATLAEYRDVDTGEHVARVARMATEIAQVLAERGHVADGDMVSRIGLAAILHDVGKIAIPESILLKPGPLDLEERRTMETHTELGQVILSRAAARSDNAALLRLAADIAYSHHERFNGTGYPLGLKGEQIPLAARIVALVDVLDALTSERPYKEPWPYEMAVETICAGTGTHFDPIVVEAFLALEERRKSTDFFAWTDSMSVGRPELDSDHKRLIGIINRLWLAEGDGNRQVIEFVLDDLVHYTEFHFRREEQMMAEVGYPDFERHREIHQAICRRLEEIRWEYFQGIREGLRGEILEFLKDWLNNHILVEDMRYRPFLSDWSGAVSPRAGGSSSK
ncbi:MAG TPA: bacteriohemerythrin [Rhodocyclaceae bacterium]